MKDIRFIIFFLLFIGLIGYLMIFGEDITHSLPLHTQGNYFNVEWDAPQDAMYYRAYISNDSARMADFPFECKQLKTPPPLKHGMKQGMIIKYQLQKEPFDLYVRLFAFYIDGNYLEIKLR